MTGPQESGLAEAVRKARHSDRIARQMEAAAMNDAVAATVSPVIAEAAKHYGVKPRTVARIALARIVP